MEKIGRVEVREKGRSDLVTEADFASQEIVCRTILSAFPNHSVVGEEEPLNGNSLQGTRGNQAEYRWIVDPLDGTTNYVHQVPHFCVSLALERGGQLQVSAVYNPVADECFLAVAGEGARLNGESIRTSSVADISQALAAVGFAAVVDPESPELKLFLAAIRHCQAMRRTGSAALNLCYVAAGRFDLSWAYSTKSWDVAAGVLMIREAGGIVTAPCGGPLLPDDGHYLAAANAQLHAQLRAIMTRAGLE